MLTKSECCGAERSGEEESGVEWKRGAMKLGRSERMLRGERSRARWEAGGVFVSSASEPSSGLPMALKMEQQGSSTWLDCIGRSGGGHHPSSSKSNSPVDCLSDQRADGVSKRQRFHRG